MHRAILSCVLLSACAAPKPCPVTTPSTVVARARIAGPARIVSLISDTARKERLTAQVRTEGTAIEVTVSGEGALLGCRWLLASAVAAVAEERDLALAPVRDVRASAVARLRLVEGLLEMSPSESELPTWETAHALATKRLTLKEVSKPLATEYAQAMKSEAELKASYGPLHPLVRQAAAVTKVLAEQRAREQQLEGEAAQQELAALEKMPKSSRTPVDVKTLRRGLLVKRLSAPGVTAERGVDSDAPGELRALAFQHLAVRMDRARDEVVYGDAHPKMIASKAELAELESAFSKALTDSIARLSSGAVVPYTEAEELRRERTALIDEVSDLTDKETMILLAPGVRIERDCAP